MTTAMIRRCLANRWRVAAVLGWAAVIYFLAPRPAELASIRALPVSGEVRVWRALAEQTEMDFTELPLVDAVNAIARRHHIDINLDRKALAEADIAFDTPMTQRVKGVSLRSALGLLLSNCDMTYTVRNGCLLLTTNDEAENLMWLNAYPVDDLVGVDNGLCTPRQAAVRAAKIHNDYGQFMDLITTTTDPASWDDVGGPGVITEAATSHAVAVRQSDAVHEEIASLLGALRVVRDEQIAAAQAVVGTPPAKVAEHDLRLTAYSIMPHPLAVSPPAPPPPPPPVDTASGDARSSENKPVGKHAELAALIAELIEPQSWQPQGAGVVRTVGDAIIIRQTEDVHRQVAGLLTELGPGLLMYWQPPDPPPPLTVDGPRRDWPAASEPRSDREAAIERALKAAAEIDVTAVPLAAVLSKLSVAHAVPMQIDTKSLAAAGIDRDAPVTRRARGMTLRELLRTLLDEFDLAYVLRYEVLVITTQMQADDLLATKVYPVFDLVCDARGKAERDAGQWQPVLTVAHMGRASNPRGPNPMAANYTSLIEGLTSCIAPATWDDVGGPGSLCPFPPAGALVVSQTTEVHEEIAQYLKALRDVAAE